MLSRAFLQRILVVGFLVLVGYSIAKAFYTQSILGIILSFVSLAATIYFFYLLAKAQEERQREGAA